MKKKKDQLTCEELEKWFASGEHPKILEGTEFSRLKIAMQRISELKEKGATKEEIAALFSANDIISREELEKVISLYTIVLENKETVKQLIKSDKNRVGKFRQSGHFIDQTLKYKESESQQITIFDILNKETKKKIDESSIEIRAEGIRLNPSEDKIIKAFYKLLHEKSENLNIASGEFYSGNVNHLSSELISYGGNEKKARAAILKISLPELYRAYLDRDSYSGDEMKHIKKTLHELCQKKFLIIYDRKRKENGKNVTDRIEDFQNLIKIISYMEGLTDSELSKLEKGDHEIRETKGELVVGLNPIFIDQIGSKYIEYPKDINKRTTIASGGHLFVTESILVLRDYMLRELSAKRFHVEINEDKLPYVLRLENYIKYRRKKLIAERIQDAIDAVKNLGIILDYEITTGASGQNKYIFKLNKHFE